MKISKTDFYYFFILIIIQLSGALSCDCGLHRVRIAVELPAKEDRCLETSNRTLTLSVGVKQCFGVCLGKSRDDGVQLACIPLSTRIRKVRLTDDNNNDLPRKRRRAYSGTKRERSAVRASAGIDLVEHVSCGCSKVRQARSPSSTTTTRTTTTTTTTLSTPATAANKTTPSIEKAENASLEVYYQTCLACKEQSELCEADGQVYDHNVCHCVYPASRTFLNSFYTLGVVMLTVMVCCFLVFGVQKGDDNVLNSSSKRRKRRRSSSFADTTRDEYYEEERHRRHHHHHHHHGHHHHHHHVDRIEEDADSELTKLQGKQNHANLNSIATHPNGNG